MSTTRATSPNWPQSRVGAGLTLVTTEKDYVRLAADQRAGVRALPVTLRFEAPERVAQALAAALADRRLSARSTP